MSTSEAFRVHGLAAAKRARKPKAAKAEVETVKVHPEVWRAALAAADGDATRLVVESPVSVVVLNKGKRVT